MCTGLRVAYPPCGYGGFLIIILEQTLSESERDCITNDYNIPVIMWFAWFEVGLVYLE